MCDKVLNGCDAVLMWTSYDWVAGIIGLSCGCFLSERMLLVRMLYGCLTYLFTFVCYVFKYWMNSLNLFYDCCVFWIVRVLCKLLERCVNAALCQLCERCLNHTGRCCVAGALPCMNLCDISVCFYCYGVIFWFDMNDSWAAVVAVLIIGAWSISAPLLHYHSIFLFTLTHFPPALSFSRSLSLPSGLNNDSGNNGQKNRTCLFLLPLFHLTFWLSLPRYHFLPHSFSVRAHLFLHAPGLSSISCERAEKRGKRRPAPLSPTV